MTRHKIAMVGLGLAVEPHIQALRSLQNRVDLVWACSRSQSRCDAFSAKYGVASTTDVDRVLDDPSIRTVLILTPPSSHLDLVSRAAQAKKHILIEKPMGLTYEEAAKCVQICEHEKVQLGVVLQHRYRPNAIALSTALAENRLGKIVAAAIQVPWWRPQSYYDELGRGTFARDGGGVLLTQAIHTLDLFRSLVGPVVRLCGVSTTTDVHRMETEDLAVALMELQSGGVATAFATTACYPGNAETIQLIGTQGTAHLTGNSLVMSFHNGTNEHVFGDEESGSGESPMNFSFGPHQALLNDFFDAAESERPPTVKGHDVLATRHLIAAIDESSRKRCWIEMPLVRQ